jgi:hypothetical protein
MAFVLVVALRLPRRLTLLNTTQGTGKCPTHCVVTRGHPYLTEAPKVPTHFTRAELPLLLLLHFVMGHHVDSRLLVTIMGFFFKSQKSFVHFGGLHPLSQRPFGAAQPPA